ncbi:hypothetical protein ACWKW6_31895 [Dyadobacter jiangsuensis]
MNQGFKLRYDDFRADDPTQKEAAKPPEGEPTYNGAGFARSVCFIWPSGRKVMLNYAYFMGAMFEAGEEKNFVRLDFSTSTVTLSGFSLETLFFQFMEQVPRLIEVVDVRYAPIADPKSGIITEIVIEKKQ